MWWGQFCCFHRAPDPSVPERNLQIHLISGTFLLLCLFFSRKSFSSNLLSKPQTPSYKRVMGSCGRGHSGRLCIILACWNRLKGCQIPGCASPQLLQKTKLDRATKSWPITAVGWQSAGCSLQIRQSPFHCDLSVGSSWLVSKCNCDVSWHSSRQGLSLAYTPQIAQPLALPPFSCHVMGLGWRRLWGTEYFITESHRVLVSISSEQNLYYLII